MSKKLATQKLKKRYLVRQHQQFPGSYQVIDIDRRVPIATFHNGEEGILRAKEYADLENNSSKQNISSRIFGLLTILIGMYTLSGTFMQAWEAKSWLSLGMIGAWVVLGFFLVLRNNDS
ncbi:hypothetical protein [Leptolyngbya sp. AN10]|uniref:hypothetical protein n=1 Tax=Leptolyngbya sp. AN10 TaxID=3423365 RepID=UPI003D312B73